MGAAASIIPESDSSPIPQIVLQKLPEVIEQALYSEEKFILIIDPAGQAGRFLKYQLGSYTSLDDPTVTKKQLNRSLVGALRYGRTMTLAASDLTGLSSTPDKYFEDGLFPIQVLQRAELLKDEVWQALLKPELGDPPVEECSISPDFVLAICTATDFVPPMLRSLMHVVKVIEKKEGSEEANGESGECDVMEQVASLYGAAETVRNSTQLVEAAFDGDQDEIQKWIDKGYHIESMDGRKHTALSEAASQGYLKVVQFLLDSGADANKVSDTGRSPLWRACFNGHIEVATLLLSVGADPDCRDKVSMESCFDVAQGEELRELLTSWDRAKTKALVEARNKLILSKIEERIKTSAEREQFAKLKIRQELISQAESGNISGIKETLTMIAQEAEKTNSRPRATVEVRNDSGMSLLSIAAQRDDVELATFLLSYWKSVDENRWDLAEGELSAEAKVFKANPNSRDLKGWSCCCIAVFHDSKRVLALLLENGGDPMLKSSYNKNAWDLAKDELDAAENVVRSRAEIRQVLLDHDARSGSKLYGTNKSGKDQKQCNGGLYEGLDDTGTAMVMNIEMNNEELAKGTSENIDEGTSSKATGEKGSKKNGGGGKKKGKGAVAAATSKKK